MANDDIDVQEGPATFRDRVVAVLAIELIAVSIALVSPVTPSKTGSTWSPADLFVEDPSYLEKALAAFVTVHVLMVLIGALAWLAVRIRPTW